MSHLIAIDGGGTGCRALIATADGAVLGRGTSGAANINSDFETALANILAAADAAVTSAGLDPAVLGRSTAVLGLAGANVGDNRARLKQRLPFAASMVCSDGVIAARGALGSNDGVVAIVGTGSVFMRQQAGTVRMIGGWGFAVGDLGSGARIGRALLERVLLAYDGIRPSSPVCGEIMQRFDGVPGNITTFASTAKPGDFATFAPLAFEAQAAGDIAAGEVIADALRDIEEGLTALMQPGCERLCLLGGLAGLVGARLSDPFRAVLSKPLGNALDGALALAMEHHAAQCRTGAAR